MRPAVAALVTLAVGGSLVSPAAAQDKSPDAKLYEMRTYFAAPGKLDDLHARFKDYTLKLFEKHGMTNVGYFVPAGDNPDNKLVYFLAYPSREARNASWKAFAADPAWVEAKAASEKDGKLVTRVEEKYLTATDYSPKAPVAAGKDRVFELRTYTAPEGKLPALDARFRDHTLKLFDKHGMVNVLYWHPAAGEKDADRVLVYLLAHASVETAKKSFDAFRADPTWKAARAESEKNGPLTEKDGGVKSEYLRATEYSPLK